MIRKFALIIAFSVLTAKGAFAANTDFSGGWLVQDLDCWPAIAIGQVTVVYYDGSSYTSTTHAMVGGQPSILPPVAVNTDGHFFGSRSVSVGLTETIAGTISGNSISFTRMQTYQQTSSVITYDAIRIITIIENGTGTIVDRVASGNLTANLTGTYFEHHPDYLDQLLVKYEDWNSSSSGTFVIILPTPNVTVRFLDADDESRSVRGAVADGRSRVIVELHGVQSSAAVTIPAGAVDGTWVSPVTLENGVWRRTWQAPESYGGSSEVPRQIGFDIIIDGHSIEPPSFALYKAPVVLLHGWMGNPGDMTNVENALVNDGFLFVYNKPYPKKASFLWNSLVPDIYVGHALDSAINQGLVAKKADIVARCMAGCLAKRYGDSSLVRRIVTIGTPHRGSPWADWLLAKFNRAFVSKLAGDAVWDMQTTVCNVPGNNLHVPVLAIAGESFPWTFPGVVALPSDDYTFYEMIFSLASFSLGLGTSPFQVHAARFGTDASDWVVSVPSQAGGLGAIIVPGIWHLEEPGNSQVIGYVTDFLNAPTGGAGAAIGESAQPQIRMDLSANAWPVPPTHPQLADAGGEMAIITPTTGTLCSPGDILHVTLTVPPSTTRVWVATPGSAAVISETPPFATDITIPQEAIGQSSIFAVAAGDEGLLAATSTMVNVTTSAFVGWLKVWPDSVLYLSAGETMPFVVHGVFSDGVERDITTSQCGTTYATTDTSVASIDTQGVLTATAPGFCFVIVSNGYSLQIPVLVKTPALYRSAVAPTWAAYE